VNISYTQEHNALGTAAPLRLVRDLDDTFLVINGDVLTTLDYRVLVRYYCEQGKILTIATHERAPPAASHQPSRRQTGVEDVQLMRD
jgi:NDP-sugar pyrophosphorylase family protein